MKVAGFAGLRLEIEVGIRYIRVPTLATYPAPASKRWLCLMHDYQI